MAEAPSAASPKTPLEEPPQTHPEAPPEEPPQTHPEAPPEGASEAPPEGPSEAPSATLSADPSLSSTVALDEQSQPITMGAPTAGAAPRFCPKCGGSLPPDSSQCPSCDIPPQEDPLLGKVLDDRYEVVRRLGAGSMGSVYEVRHVRLKKRFAMKIIHRELANIPEYVARFEREAHSCSRLEHPNCINVTDFGHAKTGELFLVMEFVKGQPLGQLIGDKPLAVTKALEITRQVLLGLQHAHQAGVIHRDIKPDNVMKVHQQVKILDFGIAKVPVSEAKGQLTQAGVVFGTPAYMAPEQAVSTAVDARADLYAVAAILWKMLTARPMFDGEGPVEILTAKLSNPAPELSRVVPGMYSQSLQTFLRKALHRNPSERHASAQEMLENLDQIVAEPGGGLAVDTGVGLAPKVRELVSKVRELVSKVTAWCAWLAKEVKEVFASWWRCEKQPDAPSWLSRVRGLVTTAHGAAVLVLSMLALSLVVGLPLALMSEPESAEDEIPQRKDISWFGKLWKITRSADSSAPAKLPPEIEKRLNRARLFLAKDACREASIDLKNLVREEPKLARAHYLLGAAMVCRKHYTDALAYYGTAMELDDRYLADARIHEDVQRMLKNSKVRMATLDFLGTSVGKPALPVLIKTASSHEERDVRRRAIELVAKLGAADKIDWVTHLGMELLQNPDIEERRRIVARLHKMGDPRAIYYLRKARDQRVRYGFFRSKHKNWTIREEIVEAIKHLLERKKDS